MIAFADKDPSAYADAGVMPTRRHDCDDARRAWSTRLGLISVQRLRCW
jgi:hypothetical protein